MSAQILAFRRPAKDAADPDAMPPLRTPKITSASFAAGRYSVSLRQIDRGTPICEHSATLYEGDRIVAVEGRGDLPNLLRAAADMIERGGIA